MASTARSTPATVQGRLRPQAGAGGRTNLVVRSGLPSDALADLYHNILTMPWWLFLGAVFLSQVLANALFAALYLIERDNLNNMTSALDAFFFSVQTWATIGYGGMTPKTTWANTVVVLESITSTIFTAVTTGLIFAKFARPNARVLFANKAILTTRDGKRLFMFRVANARGNYVVEASARVTLLRDEVSKEGEHMRRLYDLTLVRSVQPLFMMTWTVMHEIDERSPLFGLRQQDIATGDMRITVSLMGMDGTLSQTLHATHMYFGEDIEEDSSYVDVVRPLPDGRTLIDFARFHDTQPQKLQPPAAAP